jgi:tetratricopeptide (TPR) repeat protein
VNQRRLAGALAAVIAVALAAFATALRGSFVNWDDSWLIVGNPYLRGFHHVADVLDPFGGRVLLGAEYLPLRDLSNLVDFQLFGVDPAGYRLGNWLLYGLAAGLAFAFLLEALKSPTAALAAALLWAAHPLHAEVVAWASARKDLLNAVFALLAATLHLRAGRTGSRGLAWAAAGVFLLATLSKTSAAALPVVLAAWEAIAGDPAVPFGRRALDALRRAAPMLAVAAAGAALNAMHQGQGWIRAEWRGGSWPANLLVMAGVHLRYLRQALLPGGFAADYAVDEKGWASPGNLVGLLVLAAAAAATLRAARRRSRGALAGLLWLGVLLPVSNVLFPLTNASADRYLFLPSLGVCVLAGLGFERARAGGPAAARAARAALVGAVVVLGLLSARQARVWRDGVSLWSHAVEVSPLCGRAWQNYGEALSNANRGDEALAAFRRMTEVEPDNATLWVHAGNRLWQIGGRGRAAEVEAILRSAVEKARPDMGGPLVALGWVLNETGRRKEAVELLEQAARRQPTLAQARYNLGLWHLVEGRTVRAQEELEEALRLGMPLEDEIDAHGKLAEIYRGLGDAEASRRHREARERKKALTWGE